VRSHQELKKKCHGNSYKHNVEIFVEQNPKLFGHPTVYGSVITPANSLFTSHHWQKKI
jgi:hypothetical protein